MAIPVNGVRFGSDSHTIGSPKTHQPNSMIKYNRLAQPASDHVAFTGLTMNVRALSKVLKRQGFEIINTGKGPHPIVLKGKHLQTGANITKNFTFHGAKKNEVGASVLNELAKYIGLKDGQALKVLQ